MFGIKLAKEAALTVLANTVHPLVIKPAVERQLREEAAEAAAAELAFHEAINAPRPAIEYDLDAYWQARAEAAEGGEGYEGINSASYRK